MTHYVIKIDGKYLKSFRVSTNGKVKVFYSKNNEPIFFTDDETLAKNVANLLNGTVKEVTD